MSLSIRFPRIASILPRSLSHISSPISLSVASSSSSSPLLSSSFFGYSHPYTTLKSNKCVSQCYRSFSINTSTSSSCTTSPVHYQREFERSIADPNGFWTEQAQNIEWIKKGGPPLKQSGPNPYDYEWFGDWELNICANMLDRHVAAGKGEQVAIIYDSPVTHTIQHIKYKEVLDEVSRLAGALQHAGVKKGDRVLIYMPMIPQSMYGMMATIRLGAIHSVVFGGFAANELAKRIKDCTPTVILTASCGIEVNRVIPYQSALDEALTISGHRPNQILYYQRPQLSAQLDNQLNVDWVEYVNKYGQYTQPVPTSGMDANYILYTSGTTGAPKGIVRTCGGNAVASYYSMQSIYKMKPTDVYWSASDLGWQVGHGYILYAPLLYGCTTILYEGKPIGTPDAGAFWRVISQHKVTVLHTAPTALRAIKKEDPNGDLIKKYDLSLFQGVYLAGERADPDTVKWMAEHLNAPVIDHWWQTESGWPIVGNPRGLHLFPMKAGSATVPIPGWNVQVIDDDGQPVPRGKQGNLVIKLPLPPSALHTLWNNHTRFVNSYMSRFPGYYDSGDAGYQDEDGYITIISRTDDVLNVAGHRLSAGQIEEVLCDHPAVAECAIVAVPDALKGQLPVGLVVLKAGMNITQKKLQEEIILSVRKRVGAIASLKTVIIVKRLPKTRSGKILRAVMRAMAEGKDVPTPPTIEDESVLPEIKTVFKEAGIVQ